MNEVILREKEITYEDKILALLKNRRGEWVMGYELNSKNSPLGWIGSSGDRIAREMARKGLIQREGRDEGKFYAKYRLIQETLF